MTVKRLHGLRVQSDALAVYQQNWLGSVNDLLKLNFSQAMIGGHHCEINTHEHNSHETPRPTCQTWPCPVFGTGPAWYCSLPLNTPKPKRCSMNYVNKNNNISIWYDIAYINMYHAAHGKYEMSTQCIIRKCKFYASETTQWHNDKTVRSALY